MKNLNLKLTPTQASLVEAALENRVAFCQRKAHEDDLKDAQQGWAREAKETKEILAQVSKYTLKVMKARHKEEAGV